MSKTIGKVLAVAAIAVAVLAIPGVGVIGATAAAILSAGVAAATLVNSTILASKAKGSLQQRQASVQALQLGEVPREVIVGTAMTGGSLVDAFNYGGQYGTDWEALVIALADHECDALVGSYVNDTFAPFTGDGPVAGYNGQLEIHWRRGTENQTVPALLLANGPGWTPNDVGAGVCYVVVAYKADKADVKNPVWTAGRPRFSFVLRGARCYQARKDSSVGGAGPHRWSDPSTWEWTDNLIDCRYNWVRGIYACNRVGDPGQLLVGRGLNTIEAPPANVFAPANLCDELVALDAGGTEKRYTANGVLRADETYIDVEEHFASACGGVILQPEGAIEIEPGHAKAPVFFFSDEDLLVGSTVEFTDTLAESDDSWVNTVVPRYVDPALKYADHAAPIRRLVADLIADGGPRELSLSLPLVTSATQAGRVGEIQRRLGRLPQRAMVTLGPPFAEVEEGDWGVWTSQRYLKGQSIVFRVEAYGLDEKWHNRLTLRAISPDVYARDADAGSTSVVLQQQGPSIGQPGAGAWAAAAVQLEQDGASVPAIEITGAADNDFAELIRFEILPASGVADPATAIGWREDGAAGPDARRRLITSVAPGTAYFAAVSYIVGRRPGPRRILGPVTTGTSSLPWGSIKDPDGKKPDDNATNSADPDSPFGPDKTVRTVILEIADLADAQAELERGAVATDAALAALGRAGVDRDAAQRLYQRGSDRLAEAALRLTVEAGRTAGAIRDAGIAADPATGRVRLWALDDALTKVGAVEIKLDAQAASIRQRATYTDMELAIAEAKLSGGNIDLSGLYGRVTDAEQDIDALAGAITQRVTNAEFSRLGETVTEIVERIDGLGDQRGVTTDVRQVRKLTESAAEAALRGLVLSDQASRGAQLAITEARRELTTRIDDRNAVEAAARLKLAVALGSVEARLVDEQAVRIAEGVATARALSALSLVTDKQALAITDLSEGLIDAEKGIAGTRTTIRQQGRVGDQSAEALLASLLAGDQADRRGKAQFAQVQAEQTTELVEMKRSAASDRVALTARLGGAEAEAARLTRVVTENDQARAKEISDLSTTISDPATGLAAAHSAITGVDEALAEAEQVLGRSIETISGALNDPDTGLARVRGAVSDLREVVVGPAGAEVRALTVLDANGRVSGLAQTNDGSVARFEVTADIFGVYHPVTDALLFYVDMDGAVVGKLKAKSIETEQLASGASSRNVVWITTDDVVVPTS